MTISNRELQRKIDRTLSAPLGEGGEEGAWGGGKIVGTLLRKPQPDFMRAAFKWIPHGKQKRGIIPALGEQTHRVEGRKETWGFTSTETIKAY